MVISTNKVITLKLLVGACSLSVYIFELYLLKLCHVAKGQMIFLSMKIGSGYLDYIRRNKRKKFFIFFFAFSERRTSKGITNAFLIPCAPITFGYFHEIRKVFNSSNRNFFILEFSTFVQKQPSREVLKASLYDEIFLSQP